MKKMLFLSFLVFFCTGEMFSQQKLILQPNAKKGKDAVIWYINSKQTRHGDVANKNYGSEEDFKAMAWSFSGNFGEKRSLIEFDLKKIPENARIISAYLSLYANKESGDANKKGHTFLYANSNECLLQRITEPWDENQVTWNTQPQVTRKNEVLIHKSDYPYRNYENIDVTRLVRDILKNPEKNYGFMISVKDVASYKCMLFASSDHPNSGLHPKLVINYISGNNTNEDYVFDDFLDTEKKDNDKYVVIIYDEKGTEINRVKGICFDKSIDLKSGTYHFNIMKNNNIISAEKFIIY